MTARRAPAEVLGRLVAGEAQRLLQDPALLPDPARLAHGWERRFVTDRTRVAEAIDLYRSLGLDAEADPIRREELRPGCDACALVTLLQFRTIYTRKPRWSP